jgi:F0F1-type ATP synthase gamma subunit
VNKSAREQNRVQELTDKKDRVEKLIANIPNGEGYSKLKQIVKEIIKAVLSENKQIISLSFAALIQTLKADPQMVKLIHDMLSANDGKQYKDNYNNITKYLELNKERILNLDEKNYENLVETLTNDSISGAAASSSNLTISLPSSSSSTF